MKKLVLSALLLSIMGSASGMHLWMSFQLQAEGWNQQRKEAGKEEIECLPVVWPLVGIGGLLAIPCAVAACLSYRSGASTPTMNVKTNEPPLAATTSEGLNPLTMDNSTKLLLSGVALTGLTVYAGLKESQLKNKKTKIKSNNSGLFGCAMNIDFSSMYTLAPLVPAYFCFKYGFEQLRK